MTPRPRTNILPDVEVAPSRGAVKNAAGGLADTGVGTGNVSRKTGTLAGNTNLKKGSPSLSKNQQKMQSQTVGSTLSWNTTEKIAKNSSFIDNNDISKIKIQEKRGTLIGKLDKLTADKRKMVEDLLSSGKNIEIIPKSNIDRVKTPDFLVDGIKTELKTLNGTSLSTPVKRIIEGFGQHATTVIVDGRKTGLSFDDLESIINRAKGKLGGQLPSNVEIWTKQGIFRR